MIGELRKSATIVGSFSAPTLDGSVSSETVLADISVGSVIKDAETIPVYSGEYEVTPTVEGLELEAKGKLMKQDVLVRPIPYYEVSNDYGSTVYIGGGC